MNRQEVLRLDMDRMGRLAQASGGWMQFEVMDSYLERYRVQFNCAGRCLVNGVVTATRKHQFRIVLPPQYPTMAPILIWETPIYHPNFNMPYVCLLTVRSAETRLDRVCAGLWDMVRYKVMDLSSVLDPAAQRWAKDNTSIFPVDDRDLLAYVPKKEGPTDEQIRQMVHLLEPGDRL